PPLTAGSLEDVAAALAAAKVPLLVHAEDPSLILVPEGDPRRYATYLATRPPEAEATAIEQVAEIVSRTGARAHVLHVSRGAAVDARAAGGLPGGACPHDLSCASAQITYGGDVSTWTL